MSLNEQPKLSNGDGQQINEPGDNLYRRYEINENGAGGVTVTLVHKEDPKKNRELSYAQLKSRVYNLDTLNIEHGLSHDALTEVTKLMAQNDNEDDAPVPQNNNGHSFG